MRAEPRSGILSLVVAELKDSSPDPRMIEEFRGFELFSDVPDQYPVVFTMASDALDFSVQLGSRLPDLKAVIVTKEMELTGDRFDGVGVQLARSILKITNIGRVIVSAATVDVLDEDKPRAYSLIPVGRPTLDDGRQMPLFKVIHASLPAERGPDFVQAQTNLPRWGGEFVGRERELEDLRGRSVLSRMIVLLGASGIGKSRLIVEYGNHLLADQPGGVWYVDLRYAPTDRNLLDDHVATKLGIKGDFDRTAFERVTEFLGGQDATLILDSCEAAGAGVTALADDLARACPNLQILMATQEALPMSAHALYRVPPMRFEKRDSEEFSDAVKLFVARAQLYEEDFEPTDEEVAEIEGLCENLAGVPMAIELAAAAYVNQGQVVLPKASGRSVTDQVLTWVGKSLSNGEKRLAEACSTFRGPIISEIVHEIAGGTTDRDLESLRAWAVLRRDEFGRYRMPRGVQAFFSKTTPAKKKALSEKHAACFQEQSLKWEEEFQSTGQLTGFLHHSDDCHEALAWACENRQVDRVMALVFAVFDFWYRYGRFDEGLGWCHRALEACAEDEIAMSRLNNMACGLAIGKSDLRAATNYADAGIRLAVKHKNKPLQARLYLQAGLALWALQEYDSAATALRASEKCSKALGIDYGIDLAHLYLFGLESERRRFPAADKILVKIQARELPEHTRPVLEMYLGNHALLKGQYDEAREHLELAFARFHALSNTVGCVSVLRLLVPCLAKSGLGYIAAWVDGMLDRLRREVPLYWHRPQKELYDEAIVEIRRTLGEGVFRDQFDHGQFTNLDEFKKFLSKDFLSD